MSMACMEPPACLGSFHHSGCQTPDYEEHSCYCFFFICCKDSELQRSRSPSLYQSHQAPGAFQSQPTSNLKDTALTRGQILKVAVLNSNTCPTSKSGSRRLRQVIHHGMSMCTLWSTIIHLASHLMHLYLPGQWSKQWEHQCCMKKNQT